jgi:hypothetical protein
MVDIPFVVTTDQNSTRAGIYTTKLLDYDTVRQQHEYEMVVIANSTSSMATAEANISVSIININDNTPALRTHLITLPRILHLVST